MSPLKALCTCQMWGFTAKVGKKREVKRSSRGHCPLSQMAPPGQPGLPSPLGHDPWLLNAL